MVASQEMGWEEQKSQFKLKKKCFKETNGIVVVKNVFLGLSLTMWHPRVPLLVILIY